MNSALCKDVSCLMGTRLILIGGLLGGGSCLLERTPPNMQAHNPSGCVFKQRILKECIPLVLTLKPPQNRYPHKDPKFLLLQCGVKLEAYFFDFGVEEKS